MTNFVRQINDSSENIKVPCHDQLASLKNSITGKKDECSSIGGGDAPSAVKTPERIEDIKKLDKKIEVLQKKKSRE